MWGHHSQIEDLKGFIIFVEERSCEQSCTVPAQMDGQKRRSAEGGTMDHRSAKDGSFWGLWAPLGVGGVTKGYKLS